MRPRYLVAGLALAVAAVALLPDLTSHRGAVTAAVVKHEKLRKRPNIIFLMTDDMTSENMKVMRNTRRLLGDGGATFKQFIVSYALCCPSRATMLTGQYAHNHRVLTNRLPNGGFYRFRSANALPVWLQDGGYYTAHIGKYLNGYGRKKPHEVPPGWDDWYTSIDPSTYRYWNYTMNENGKLVHYGDELRDYITTVDQRRAVQIIKKHGNMTRPLYLQVDFLAPHSGAPVELDDPPRMATPAPAPRDRDRFVFLPLPMPPNYNEADVRDKPIGIRRRPLIEDYSAYAITEDYQQRLESLLSVDTAVAAIVQALKKTRELNNTYIFFSSDNGFFQGEHRIPSGKVLPYEEALHLPLLVRGPGIQPGTVLDQLVGNVDLAPTIAEMAKVTPGLIEDGESFLDLMKTGTWDTTRNAIVVEGGPFDKPSEEFEGLRTLRYQFSVYGNGEVELYDLVTDPYELDNKANDPTYATIRGELAAQLEELSTCAGEGCRS